jgi:multiple sugar transport system substrate-binding protein
MKVRRSTAGLMALLLIFTLLSGCSLIGDGKEEENPQKQLYFYYPPDGSFLIKSLILKFNSMQEKIIVQGIEGPGSRGEFMDQLHELNQAGETVPGVILIHDTWLAKLASEQAIRSLDGGLSQDKRNRFFAGMADAMLWEGQTYGLPFWQDMPLLYYRKDLMESPPTAWEDLSRMAVQIKKDNEMEYGFIFPGESEENGAAFLAGIWSCYGMVPDFEAEETIFDEQVMASTWNSLTSMVKNEAISSNSLSMSAENCRTIFETGNAVFMWNWSYAARLFLDEESPVKGKVGVTTLPVSGDGEAGGILSGYALAMSSKTGLISESWEFMQFLASEESQQLIRDAGLLPAEKSLYQPVWMHQTGLPSGFPDMMQSGYALKPGRNVDGTLNVMAGAVSLAFQQNKTLEDFILLLKEGVIDEQPVNDDIHGSEDEEQGETDDVETDQLNESENAEEDSE